MNAMRTQTCTTRPRPAGDLFLRDVVAGLSRPCPDKTLPCKYFYDRRGSELFDRICGLPEYYPTRIEAAILSANAQAISQWVGDAALIEFGSGSSSKTRILLDRLPDLSAYVPIDISREHLFAAVRALRADYPHLSILPLCADYTRPLQLPELGEDEPRRVVFFPGSTIGNFHPPDAAAFLRNMAEVAGAEGGVLIGVDLRKDAGVLVPAYDDAQGVTAAFNLNLLARINHELGGTFDLSRFSHRAVWNDGAGRVEMHLVSRGPQRVRVGDDAFTFRHGEAIRTECSYKYTLEGFAELAGRAGLDVRQRWLDADRYFSVQYLTPR